jgi:hypothetical protein
MDAAALLPSLPRDLQACHAEDQTFVTQGAVALLMLVLATALMLSPASKLPACIWFPDPDAAAVPGFRRLTASYHRSAPAAICG